MAAAPTSVPLLSQPVLPHPEATALVINFLLIEIFKNSNRKGGGTQEAKAAKPELKTQMKSKLLAPKGWG